MGNIESEIVEAGYAVQREVGRGWNEGNMRWLNETIETGDADEELKAE